MIILLITLEVFKTPNDIINIVLIVFQVRNTRLDLQ